MRSAPTASTPFYRCTGTKKWRRLGIIFLPTCIRSPPREWFASDNELARSDDEDDELPLPPAPAQELALATAPIPANGAQDEDAKEVWSEPQWEGMREAIEASLRSR